MVDNRRFQRRLYRSAVYTCDSCGKRTRETGYGESDVGFCKRCYREAELDNSFSDGDISEDEYTEQLALLQEK